MSIKVAERLLNTARALSVMEEIGVDALVATEAQNVTYSSNFWAL